MKKAIFSLATGLLLQSLSHAQDEKRFEEDLANLTQQQKELKVEKKADQKVLRELEAPGASNLSKDAFYSEFGNLADVSWSRNGIYEVASFVKDGQNTKAYFDPESNLIGSSEEKSFSDIPVNAQYLIDKKYGDYAVTHVLLFDNREDSDIGIIPYTMDKDNYYVMLEKPNKKMVLQVDMEGNVYFFRSLK